MSIIEFKQTQLCIKSTKKSIKDRYIIEICKLLN